MEVRDELIGARTANQEGRPLRLIFTERGVLNRGLVPRESTYTIVEKPNPLLSFSLTSPELPSNNNKQATFFFVSYRLSDSRSTTTQIN